MRGPGIGGPRAALVVGGAASNRLTKRLDSHVVVTGESMVTGAGTVLLHERGGQRARPDRRCSAWEARVGIDDPDGGCAGENALVSGAVAEPWRHRRGQDGCRSSHCSPGRLARTLTCRRL